MRKTNVKTLYDPAGNIVANIQIHGDGSVKISHQNGYTTKSNRIDPDLANSAIADFFEDVVLGNNLKRVTANSLWHSYIIYCLNHAFIAEPLTKFSRDFAEISDGQYFQTKANITQQMVDDIFDQDEYVKLIKDNMGHIGYRVSSFFRRDLYAEYRPKEAIDKGIVTEDNSNVIEYFKHVFKIEFRIQRISTIALHAGYQAWCKEHHETPVNRNTFYQVLNDEMPKHGYVRKNTRMRKVDFDNIVSLHKSGVNCFDYIDKNQSRSTNSMSLVVLK